jgi:putative transcriptional regulator
MSRHPAPDELLLDYAAGVLPGGPALAVALHVALDPAARRMVRRLRGLGGALLESDAGAAEMGEAALEQALARLDAVPVDAPRARAAARPGFDWAPVPLRRYLAGKDWRRVFGGFEEMRLDLQGGSHRVSLLRAAARAGTAGPSPCCRGVHRRVARRIHRQHRQLRRW